MCGRTCLTLDPKEIQSCCKYQISNGKNQQLPEYRNEFNCGRKYQPSHNIAPTDITPVLVSAAHFNDDHESASRLLVPMMWSMVPRWHKGDYRKHGLTTNNCRLENLAMSKLFKPVLNAGNRCVILCEGFYEWQTTKTLKPSERPVNYIYMPQDKEVKIEDRSTWNFDTGGIRLLKMAGLFDVWEDENGDKLYSYAVITLESNKRFAEIHHRIPAILDTDEEVAAWLDFKNIGTNQALNILKPCEYILWYSVSKIVNNSRNKSDQCNKPAEQSEALAKDKVATRKNKFMETWLMRGKRPHDEDNGEKEKKTKL